MRNGLRLGKILGIEVRVDWSWLFIFFLVTWNLAMVFGQRHADWGLAVTWGTALAASLLFFASVLAHEMAHSLVARSRGMPVHNITLFLFGGVSNIQREPTSPQSEFLMAIVGPLTSIVLGYFFLILAHTTISPWQVSSAEIETMIGRLSPLSTLLLWLGPVNILVGLFNLLPGFPLDGGRILRSLLWAVTGNLRKATRWAAGAGQALAGLMIFLGFAMVFGVWLPIFGSGSIGGLWFVFIGWFLYSASTQSYQQVVIRDILQGVPVSRMMRTEPPQVSPNITIDELVGDYIMRADDYAFPVLDGDELVGLVTLEDVRKVSRDEWPSTRVAEIMTPGAELVVVAPANDAAEALNLLSQRDVRQLPVVQDGRLVGLLRRRDMMKWLQLHSEFGTD